MPSLSLPTSAQFPLRFLYTENSEPYPIPDSTHFLWFTIGNVEKSRQWRSRPFAVLTYWEYAPRVKRAAALLDEPFGKTQGMLF